MNRNRLLLAGCSLLAVALMGTQFAAPGTAHATGPSPVELSAAIDGGMVIVSPQSGLLTYCPGYASIAGQGTSLSATPVGACTTLTGARPSPTSGKWTLTNVPNSRTFFLLDSATGAIINCAVTTQIVVGVAPTVYAAGSCQNWGTAPQ